MRKLVVLSICVGALVAPGLGAPTAYAEEDQDSCGLPPPCWRYEERMRDEWRTEWERPWRRCNVHYRIITRLRFPVYGVDPHGQVVYEHRVVISRECYGLELGGGGLFSDDDVPMWEEGPVT